MYECTHFVGLYIVHFVHFLSLYMVHFVFYIIHYLQVLSEGEDEELKRTSKHLIDCLAALHSSLEKNGDKPGIPDIVRQTSM